MQLSVNVMFGTKQQELANLDETNFLGIATEALPATHKPVLPDHSMWIPAYTAERRAVINT